MRDTIDVSEVTFLVSSCDKYSDLWEPFFENLFKYWPDLPFEVTLISNFKKFPDKRVRTIQLGTDESYADNLRRALAQINTNWVVLWLDDVIIDRKVDQKTIELILRQAYELNASFVKLSNDLPIVYKSKTGYLIDELPKGIKYRSAIGLTLAKKSTLIELAEPGFSAWDMDKSTLSDNLEAKFCAYTKFGAKNPAFGYIHAVVKGEWLYSSVQKLRRQGFTSLINGRKRQSLIAYIYILLYQARLSIFSFFNIYWR